jgi:hypothetical protein
MMSRVALYPSLSKAQSSVLLITESGWATLSPPEKFRMNLELYPRGKIPIVQHLPVPFTKPTVPKLHLREPEPHTRTFLFSYAHDTWK